MQHHLYLCLHQHNIICTKTLSTPTQVHLYLCLHQRNFICTIIDFLSVYPSATSSVLRIYFLSLYQHSFIYAKSLLLSLSTPTQHHLLTYDQLPVIAVSVHWFGWLRNTHLWIASMQHAALDGCYLTRMRGRTRASTRASPYDPFVFSVLVEVVSQTFWIREQRQCDRHSHSVTTLNSKLYNKPPHFFNFETSIKQFHRVCCRANNSISR